jgi:alpha-amylase/alpha-mannosidase (GH57 family)
LLERYICIHGHFYQPPRENPWLEAIEQQDSAYPYHDWNERIAAECYAPNARARVLDGEDRIIDIANNYSRISFNFGPTLLSWLEVSAPEVYQAVIEADTLSRERFSGHGSALAQAYNHMILPLANERDKRTQVLWGIRDFEARFKRRPEGMWLAETAVDTETLEALADAGVRFTILAPSQAKRTRPLGGRSWKDVTGGRIDPSRAYEARLPSGRHIALFFYDGPISRAVAFEGLLRRGEYLADRLAGAFSDARDWPQLVHIATDGETYGHHHRQGEMALAYALRHIEEQGLARLTNYGEYLERHPPTHQVEILEKTAWSCVHGVGRWWTDCGCNSGGHSDWNQSWRTPLRDALDGLRDELVPRFEETAGELLKDPWEARDAYIDVILDRGPKARARFLEEQRARTLSEADEVRILQLMELQRHAQLMYTSCGWFFDELSGIETVQVIRYAGAALQLAGRLFGDGLEDRFRDRLGKAKSNLAEHGDGAQIYDKWVRPGVVDLLKVGAHYAISSLFEGYAERMRLYSYSVERENQQVLEAGRARLLLGRALFSSEVTQEHALLSYGVMHYGDHTVVAGVREFRSAEAFEAMARDATAAFEKADFPEAVRAMDRHFEGSNYSLKSLFRDEQRKLLQLILETTLEETTAVYRQVYENHAPLMRFIGDLGVPLPRVLRTTAQFVLNSSLRQELREETPDLQQLRALFDAAEKENVSLDREALSFDLRNALERLMRAFHAEPDAVEPLDRLIELASLARSLPFEVDLARPQDLYWEIRRDTYPGRSRASDEASRAWSRAFERLGTVLGVHVPSSAEPVEEEAVSPQVAAGSD